MIGVSRTHAGQRGHDDPFGNSNLPMRTEVKSGCGRAVKISFSIGITPFGSLSRHVAACLRRRLCHQVIELRHKRAFVWSGITTERLGAFHKDLVHVGT